MFDVVSVYGANMQTVVESGLDFGSAEEKAREHSTKAHAQEGVTVIIDNDTDSLKAAYRQGKRLDRGFINTLVYGVGRFLP